MSLKIEITKIITFEAGHKLVDIGQSDDYNVTNYGKCYGDRKCMGHGHSYVLEVTVTGPVQPNGFIMNFSTLKVIIQRQVFDKFDHKFLNQELNYITSSENMVQDIWNRVKDFLPRPVRLKRVKLWETANSSCTIEDGSVW